MIRFTTAKKIILLFILLSGYIINAQEDEVRLGDQVYRHQGIHNANKVRTVFTNYGLVAGIFEKPEGEWPKGSGNEYVGDVSPLFGVEIRRDWEWQYTLHDDGTVTALDPEVENYFTNIDSLSQIKGLFPYVDHTMLNDTLVAVHFRDTVTSVATSDGPRGWTDGPGEGGIMWTLEPKPGYADDEHDEVAISTDLDNDGDGKPDSWPSFWPDQPNWIKPDGSPFWNGYFGKGVMAADQESYFVMDDSEDAEFNYYKQGEGPRVFMPDSTIPQRYGAGLDVSVRGLQWSHFLAEDIIYWLYKVENAGEKNYQKVSFGMMVGTLSGGRCNDYIDAQDDLSYFDNQDDITYSWDAPPSYSPCFDGPVGYAGYAYLESPGNPYDGVDNDGDSDNPSPQLEESFFQKIHYDIGDKIVLIEKDTYERSIYTIKKFPDTVFTTGKRIILTSNNQLEEVVGNIIDDNLNGVIDEDYFTHYYNRINRGEGFEPLPPLKYVDYITGAGSNDPLIDERRDDGIDNDGDWKAALHDVGRDGVAGTGDYGEGDGSPTNGEPNFDKVDVNESDQIGLTSFNYFTPPGKVRMSDDYDWSSRTPGDLWNRQTPGNYDEIVLEPADGDFIYGAGYFPLPSGRSGSFSMALLFGEDFEDILNNKKTNQQIYDNNYQFTRPPDKPTVHAVEGDGKVTLYWDNAAENSIDPVLGKDFEGYKIYRATDIGFNEVNTITNAKGVKYFYEPIAIFDKKDGIKGFYRGDASFTGGVSFNLGNDSGLQHTYTDTTVNNGMTYYYAVVSYDHGDASTGIFPAECSKSIQKLGTEIVLDKNTVAVQPTSNVAGYIPPDTTKGIERVSGAGDGNVHYSLLNPNKLAQEAEHNITIKFYDSATDRVDNDGDGLIYHEGELEYEILDTVVSVPASIDSQEISFAYPGGDTTMVFPPTLRDVDEAFARITTYYSIIDSYQQDDRQIDSLVVNKSSRFGIAQQNIANVARTLHTTTDKLFPQKYDIIPDYPLGLKLYFENTWITEIADFGWESAEVQPEPKLEPWIKNGHFTPGDYELSFSNNTNQSFVPNLEQYGEFTSYDISLTGENIYTNKTVDIALRDNGDGNFGIEDTLVLFERLPAATKTSPGAIQRHATWMITFAQGDQLPDNGKLTITTSKPLNNTDQFLINIQGARSEKVNLEKIKDKDEKIHVVPNPYQTTAVWEPRLPSIETGRAERKIEFMNVPAASTIRIFTVRGDLVKTLHHDGGYSSGSVSWDLISRDGLPVAYGVYVYHVSGPQLKEDYTGKFAVIK
jgi:hypothetical protein